MNEIEALAKILDQHYLAHCVANPESFYGNDKNGRYWKCGCSVSESHIPKGITIKHSHHLHVAEVIAASYERV